MSGSTHGESSAAVSGVPKSPVTSPWAVASLLCGVAVCCLPIVSILLGARALIQIKADPSLRGRRMALTGITLGVLATIGWIGGAVWWHFNARLPMMHGPREELRAGSARNIALFKAGFHAEGTVAPDADVVDFLTELDVRYGRFIDSSLSATPSTKPTLTGPSQLVICYTLQFDRQSVEAQAEFITFAPARVIPRPVFKWGWLRVIDPQRGDLVYPVAAPLAAPP